MLVMLNMFYIIIRSERNQKRFWFIRQGILFNGGLTQSINDNITFKSLGSVRLFLFEIIILFITDYIGQTIHSI